MRYCPCCGEEFENNTYMCLDCCEPTRSGSRPDDFDEL